MCFNQHATIILVLLLTIIFIWLLQLVLGPLLKKQSSKMDTRPLPYVTSVNP
jgi:hypothetical protein